MNDAIYAANDGLGSIFGVVAGVAGATLGNSHFILIAGLAGMIGSALTTGTGAYLSAKSEQELFEASLARERRAVDYDEAEAREVLASTFRFADCRKRWLSAWFIFSRKTRSDSSRPWRVLNRTCRKRI